MVADVFVALKSFDEICSSHHPHKQKFKTDPEGEGTTEVWELQAQQHDITLRTLMWQQILHLGYFIGSLVPESELVLWQSVGCDR